MKIISIDIHSATSCEVPVVMNVSVII